MGQTRAVSAKTGPTMEYWFQTKSPRAGPREEARQRREVRQLFSQADINGDGKLTPEEWLNLLNMAGINATKEEVEIFFSTMDRDFDGRLSFSEIMGEETAIETLFKQMDKDGDGFVSKKEFKKICKKMDKEQVKKAFSRFDSDGDDRLDYREFCEMIKQQREDQK